MHGDASLATRSCLCGRLFVNDFEKNIGENQATDISVDH